MSPAGFSDGQITEIVAHVALIVFTTWFNNVARTELALPRMDPLLPAERAS